jgi:hypothetical protein
MMEKSEKGHFEGTAGPPYGKTGLSYFCLWRYLLNRSVINFTFLSAA